MTENEKLDEVLLDGLTELQAKFVIKILLAANHVSLWAVNKAIEIASTFSQRK